MRALLLLAVVACRDAPAKLPEPVLAIEVGYAGASAEVVEREVVMPFEHAAHRLGHATEARVDEGRATILVESGDLDRASHELLHVALPVGVPLPAFVRRRKDETPALVYELRGALPVAVLSQQARTEIVPRIAAIPGVGRIADRHFAREVTVVTVEPERLAAYGVTIVEVVAAIEREADVVRDLVRVADVATVARSVERDASGPPTIEIFAQPAAEPAAVAAKVKDALAALPPGVTLEPVRPAPPRPRAPLTITVVGPEPSVADALVAQLQTAGITATVDPPAGSAEPQRVVDPAQRAVDPREIAATLRALGGTGDIVVRIANDDVDRLQVRSRDGALVPLSSVVRVEYAPRRSILRRNGVRAIVLSIDAPKDKIALARRLASERVVPAGYRIILTP